MNESKSRLAPGNLPMFTEVTYTKIWFGDLTDLFRSELGVVIRGDNRNYDTYDFDWSEDCYPFGQDTHIIVSRKDTDGYVNEGDDKLSRYLKQLWDKGKLPDDNPLFIDIWW